MATDHVVWEDRRTNWLTKVANPLPELIPETLKGTKLSVWEASAQKTKRGSGFATFSGKPTESKAFSCGLLL